MTVWKKTFQLLSMSECLRQSASIPLSDTSPMRSSSYALITSSMSKFHMQPALLLHGCRCRSHTHTHNPTHSYLTPIDGSCWGWSSGGYRPSSHPILYKSNNVQYYSLYQQWIPDSRTLKRTPYWSHCSRGNWEWLLFKHPMTQCKRKKKNCRPLLPLATSTWEHQWYGVIQLLLFIALD